MTRKREKESGETGIDLLPRAGKSIGACRIVDLARTFIYIGIRICIGKSMHVS